MSAYQTKGSRLALVTEVTEGTPVSPSSASEYIALQDGYSLDPEFASLENKELTGTIGKAKPIVGIESPKAALKHYIRHSGVEGTAPNFGRLIESVFGGKTLNSTQYLTTSGSTAGTSAAAATIAHAAGTGTNFQRGQALLIKDTTNGYSIRNVLSVATDTSTLNFNLSNAPATGMGLGKAQVYKPGTSYPSFSVFDYRGNGGAVQMAAGMKVLELSIDANAAELITGDFKLEGLSFYYDPIEITSSSKYIDFNDGGVKAATVVTGFYKDPVDLADAIGAAMDAASSDTITCTYSSSTGKFTITSDGSTLSLLWNTGANTANSIAAKIGFSTAANSTAALTYTSANALTLTSPQTPSFDSADPLVAKANEVFIGGYADSTSFCASSVKFSLKNSKTNVKCLDSASGNREAVITQQEVSVDITATLSRYEADKFHRYHNNSATAFAYNFGEKVAGNWVAGKCANIYMPTATVTKFKVSDQGGLVGMEITLTGYVDSSGNGEVYLNFL